MANNPLSSMSLADLEALRAEKIGKVKFKNSEVAKEFQGISPRLKGLVANAPESILLTSGKRTPESNAAAGGVPNSYHLRGDAVDIRKPSEGFDPSYFQKQGYQVIDEGDHLHLEPGPGAPQTKKLQDLSDEELANLHNLTIQKQFSSIGQQQGLQAGFPVPSDVQYDVRTHQPVVTGSQVEPTLGGLVPGINYQQARENLPLATATALQSIGIPAPLGGALGKALSNFGDTVSGERAPAQGFLEAAKEPASTGAEYAIAELLGRLIPAGIGKGYQALSQGKDALSGLARFGRGGSAIMKSLEGQGELKLQKALDKVTNLPEELGIGAPKDVKEIVGNKLRDAITAPQTGINSQVSKAYESAKNPILLKYGAQPIPNEQLSKLVTTIDDKAASEVNPNVLSALNTLKKDIHPDMTLMDLYKFQKRAQDIISSGGEESGAIGKIYQPIKSSLNESIGKLASPEEAKLYSQADKAYAESKDVISRFEGKFTKKAKGFDRPQPGESIFQGVANDISKNPSLIESSIKTHPELKEPLSDVIMTDIANKVGMGQDINKVIKFYNIDRLKNILPEDYSIALEQGIKNINKLNPINKQKALSEFIWNTVKNKNKTGQLGSFIGRGVAGYNDNN